MTTSKVLFSTVWILVLGIFISICVGGCGGGGGDGGGGGGVGNVTGIVYDTSYQPVGGATIVIEGGVTTTRSDGTYSFINLSSGDKVIRITVPGYTPSFRKVTVARGTTVAADPAFVYPLDAKVTSIDNLVGGLASSTNGSIKVNFLAGDLGSNQNIVLTSVPRIAAPFNPPEEQQFVSYVLYALPNIALVSSSELSVPNLTGITTEETRFYRFDMNTFEWVRLPGVGLWDVATNAIKYHTEYLGWIAALQTITPAPGWITGIVRNGNTYAVISGANVWTDTSYAISDSTGAYRLNYVPTGTREVSASAAGYDISSEVVQVDTDTETVHNILLFLSPGGTITGTVKHGITAIEGARVHEYSGGTDAYTDSYGRFTFYNVPGGTFIITAVAAGYSGSSETRTLSSGGTLTVNFLLSTANAFPYSYDFEVSEEGFTRLPVEVEAQKGNLWHRQYASSTPTLNPRNYYNRDHFSGPDNQTRKVLLPTGDENMPAAHSGSWYFWCGTAEGNENATGEASYIGVQLLTDVATTLAFITGGTSHPNYYTNMSDLESSPINLSGYAAATLSFWTWWEIEGANPSHGKDVMGIYISKSPYSTWDHLGNLNPFEDPNKTISPSCESYTSGGYNMPAVWIKHNLDISDYAGFSVKVRFVFDLGGDHLYNGYRGWVLDDISISSESGVSSNFSNLQKTFTPLQR